MFVTSQKQQAWLEWVSSQQKSFRLTGNEVAADRNVRHLSPDLVDQRQIGLPRVAPAHALQHTAHRGTLFGDEWKQRNFCCLRWAIVCRAP